MEEEKKLTNGQLEAIKDAIYFIHYAKHDFLSTSDDYKTSINTIDKLNEILISNGIEKYLP